MKLLIVTQDYPPPVGGIATFVRELELNLEKNNIDFRILNFDNRNRNNYELLRLRDFFPTKVTQNSYYSPMSLLNPKNFFSEIKGFREFVYQNMVYRIVKNEVKKFSPDLIHVTHAKMQAAFFSEIPTLLSVYSEEISNVYPIFTSVTRAKKILTISDFGTDLLIKTFPAAEPKSKKVGCPVNLKKYYTNFKNKKKILTISRLVKAKNVETLVRSFSMLPKEIQKELQWDILGDGPEKENLLLLTKELQLDSQITFHGSVSEQEKLNFLSEAGIFILAPIPFRGTKEGFGIVFLEAQATGTPSIASKTGGIIDAAGKGAMYVNNPADPREISDCIIKLLTDKQVYLKLKNESKKRIEYFDSPKWFSRVLAEYKEVFESN